MMRPPWVFWCCLWGLGAAVATVSIGSDIFRHSLSNVLGRDFSNLWVAGKLALSGQVWAVFNPDGFRTALHDYLGMLSLQNYSYPPHALFIAVPFALLPYYVSLAVWTLLGSILFIWAAQPFLPRGFPRMLAILTPAATLNIWNGHYGFLLGALWLVCFRNLQTKPSRSGLAAAALTFKPHLGLFIALAVCTRKRALLFAIGGGVVLIVASQLIFGGWADFLTRTVAEQDRILTTTEQNFYFMMMPSAYVAFGRNWLGIAVQTVVAMAALGLLAKKPTLDPFALSTATFVIIPYCFGYDMTVACLGFAIALYSRWADLSWLARLILSGAFLSPELTYFFAYPVPFLLVSALAIQLRLGTVPAEGREDVRKLSRETAGSEVTQVSFQEQLT
jgi:hypothetical protein